MITLLNNMSVLVVSLEYHCSEWGLCGCYDHWLLNVTGTEDEMRVKVITLGGSVCIHMFPLSRESPLCIPAPSCVVLACPDGWGLKDANVHAGAADLPQRLTLHQWKWKPVNQQAAVALVPPHHSLWHRQPRQEHINHKHRPQHCAVGTEVSHPFIHLALTLTHTTYIHKWWDGHARTSIHRRSI